MKNDKARATIFYVAAILFYLAAILSFVGGDHNSNGIILSIPREIAHRDR